jgi:hypothetical protein
LIDRSNYGKGVTDALHASAFKSKTYLKRGLEERNDFVSELTVKNKLVKLLQEDQFVSSQSDVPNPKRRSNTSAKRQENVANKLFNEFDVEREMSDSRDTIDSGKSDSESVFTDAFYYYIMQKRCLLGCEGLLYPYGYKLNLLVTSLSLPEGVYEDFIIHLCNNNSLFSCIYSVKGSMKSRNACRLVYIVQNCIAFFIFSFTNMMFDYVGLNSNYSVLSDILITSPLSLFFGSIALGLYTCPLVNTVDFEKSRFGWFKKYIVALGRLMIVPYVMLMFGLLLLSAVCTSRSNIFYIILSFIWQAQLQTFILELIYTILLFKSTFYYQVKVAGVPLLEVGSLFAERVSRSLHHEYYMYYSRYLQGMVIRDYIAANRVVSMKEIAVESPMFILEAQDVNRVTVTMPGFKNVDDVEVYDNPLFAKKQAPKLSMVGVDTTAALPYATSTMDSYDPENEFNDSSVLRKNKFQPVTLNPMLAAANTPLNVITSRSMQPKSDIELDVILSSNKLQSELIEHYAQGDDDEEEEANFDDASMAADTTVKAVVMTNEKAPRRRSAFLGFDTTNDEKRKGTNPNAMQNRVAALKDTKRINPVAIIEGEENDDVLYEEFQAFKNDINRNSEVEFQSESDDISFDDWKIKRKQLKEVPLLTHLLTHSLTYSLTYSGNR